LNKPTQPCEFCKYQTTQAYNKGLATVEAPEGSKWPPEAEYLSAFCYPNEVANSPRASYFANCRVKKFQNNSGKQLLTKTRPTKESSVQHQNAKPAGLFSAEISRKWTQSTREVFQGQLQWAPVQISHVA